MSEDSPIERLLLKTKRADKHVQDFVSEWAKFTKANPHTTAFTTNPKTGNRTYSLIRAPRIPAEFSLLIGDIVYNLRSALDNLAYHLVKIGGGTTRQLSDVYFPICASASEYKTGGHRKIQGMRKEAKEFIDALQPYLGGAGEYLCHLRDLNNFDKHKLLVPVWSLCTAHTALRSQRVVLARFFRRQETEFKEAFFVAKNKLTNFPLKPGDELLTVAASDVDEKMHFVLDIAFGEPKIVKGNPVIETLHEMRIYVAEIISSFDKAGLLR
jgi:hypothetical protein